MQSLFRMSAVGLIVLTACVANVEPADSSSTAPSLGGTSNAGAAGSSGGSANTGASGGDPGGGHGGGGATSSSGSGGRGSVARGGNGGSNGGVGGLGGTGSVVPECVLTLFEAGDGRCSGSLCHDQGFHSSAGLDLASPGVESRLVDVAATHEDVEPGASCGSGDKLIDSADPSQSWLLKKLTPGAFGECGSRMPVVGSLSETELGCLRDWVMSF